MEQRADDGRADVAAKSRQPSAEGAAESGWVTTKVAAAALGVSPRSVRDYIRQGKLEAKHEGEAVNKSWYVTITSVQALREERRLSGELPRAGREEEAAEEVAEIAAAERGEMFRELLTRVESRAAEAAELRARLELTAQAESTLREDLERERERADRAERRLEELEAKPKLPPEPRDGPETASKAHRGATLQDAGESPGTAIQRPREEAKPRSWWRRLFGS